MGFASRHNGVLSSLIFSLLLFSSLTLPTFAFRSAHVVGGLTSKLPWIILYYPVTLHSGLQWTCNLLKSKSKASGKQQEEAQQRSSKRHQNVLTDIIGIQLRTSSSAQGGGGSFKNRKPIGELGCCESRMAERIH